jgi:hypothetical protein
MLGDVRMVLLMPIAVAKKSVRKSGVLGRKKPVGFKAVPGSPLFGLEHMVGCVTLPRTPRSRRETLRGRILADHNT